MSSMPGIGGSGGSYTTEIVEYPVPDIRCPSCLEPGDTVPVIPGKACLICGTPVN